MTSLFKYQLLSGILTFILILPPNAGATESIFGYSYTTDTLPKNKWEIAQSYYGKYDKGHGSYANSLYRTQIEYGLFSFFQTSIYLNNQHIYANHDNANGTTGGEGVPENANPNASYNRFRFHTVSLENIYRVLSPYTHSVGVAFVFEPSLGRNQDALDHRLVLQKNFKEDRLVLAQNIKWRLEWNRKTGLPGVTEARWAREAEFEYSSGIMYRFIRNVSAGTEFLGRHRFSSFSPGDIQNAAFFLGPTMHYGARRFWATLSVLFQLPLAAGFNETQRNAIEGGRIFGNSYEVIEVRTKMGCVF